MKHQTLGSRLIGSAEGGTSWLHKITKPTVWRGGMQILDEKEEDVRPLARCEEMRENGSTLAVRHGCAGSPRQVAGKRRAEKIGRRNDEVK